MPQELPGFYYDPEKNRYFPVKGPIPGFTRKPVSPPLNSVSVPTQVPSKLKKDVRISKLLHYRELYGSIVDFSNRKGSFQEECTKKLASKPKIWKYQGVEKDADSSLALMNITVETPEGQCASDALLAGGINGCLSLFNVGDVGHDFSHGVMTTAEFVWPEKDELDSYQTLNDIWKFNGASLMLPSSVTSIRMLRKEDIDSSALQHALITTLGAEAFGGSLYVLNLADPVDPSSNMATIGRLREIVSLDCTIWGAESSHCGRRAVVGTNRGATLVDLESGVPSVLCRSDKSDVLSVQLIQSGNVALCGLRNGAIVTVDIRQRQRQLAQHRIPNPPSDFNRRAQKTTKRWFLVKIKTSLIVFTFFFSPYLLCILFWFYFLRKLSYFKRKYFVVIKSTVHTSCSLQ